jgi:hypothetical protein
MGARAQIKAYAQSSSRDSILAFGNPGFASDEHRTVQAPNCTTGVAMTLIKKIDVKNYLANRPHKRVRPAPSTSLPDATGISGPDPGLTGSNLLRPNPSEFAKDFLAEHSADRAAGPDVSQAPATPKSA